MLRPISIDLDDLIFAMQTHDNIFEHHLDLKTGKVLTLESGHDDFEEEDGLSDDLDEKFDPDDPERYIYIEPCPSREVFRMMEDFIGDQKDEKIKRRLSEAILHKKPFRSFKDALTDFPEIRAAWFDFENRRMLSYAREWLKENDINLSESV